MCSTAFPSDDRMWLDVADFIAAAGCVGPILAPPEFTGQVPCVVYAYDKSLDQQHVAHLHFAVLHKGRLNEVPGSTLKTIHRQMRPVFANEVFVVFSPLPGLAPLSPDSPHLVSYWQRFSEAFPPLPTRARQFTRNLLFSACRKLLEPLIREILLPALRPEILDVGAQLLSQAKLSIRETALELIRTELHNAEQGWTSQHGAYRPVVYLGNHLALTRTTMGHKIIVDTRDVSLSYHILLDGLWESWVTNVIQATVQPGWNVVEVGANVGYYSLLIASLVGPNGRLFAFEANPSVYQLLRLNLEINGFLDRAVAVGKAVWESSAVVEFGVAGRHLGGSGIFTFGTPDEPVERVMVEAISLDEFFPEGTRIDLLKMDAEGSEFFILRGA